MFAKSCVRVERRGDVGVSSLVVYAKWFPPRASVKIALFVCRRVIVAVSVDSPTAELKRLFEEARQRSRRGERNLMVGPYVEDGIRICTVDMSRCYLFRRQSRFFGRIITPSSDFHELYKWAQEEAQELPKLDGSSFVLDGVLVMVSAYADPQMREDLHQLFLSARTPGLANTLKVIGPTPGEGVHPA